MTTILQAAIGSIIRWGLALLAGYLVKAGIWSATESETYIAAGALAGVALLWSLWQKYHSRLSFLTALESPPGTTEKEVKEAVKDKAADGTSLKLFLVLLLPLFACQPGCRALAPGGIYQGDKVVCEAEATIVTSYQLVNTFLTWEVENRSMLKAWPEVTRAADKLRHDYPLWYATANSLRDAYVAAPGAEIRTQLEKSLQILRTALTEAAKYMALATQPPK